MDLFVLYTLIKYVTINTASLPYMKIYANLNIRGSLYYMYKYYDVVMSKMYTKG